MGKTICIIPARGGSKRIPGKNIKPFLGKPIIQYSIEAALKSALFDVVMVSTDSEEIASLSKSLGASVPFFRTAENSDDFSATYDVIKEVLETYEKQNEQFDVACCLYPTAPFITSDKLIEANKLQQSENAEAVMSVVEFSYPIQRSLSINSSEFIEMNWEENLKKRSQDLERSFHDAGQFYFYDTKKYLAKKSAFQMNCKPYILSELEVQDIDTETDWKLAEMKYTLSVNEKWDS